MIIGIDPSTRYYAIIRLAEAPVDGKPVILGMEIVGSSKARLAEERLCSLYEDFTAWAVDNLDSQRDSVWCEDTAFVGGSRSLVQMAAAIHNVRLVCATWSIPCYFIQNPTWKKEVIGKGNADKAAIKDFLCQHFHLPADWSPPDLYDAYAIAVAGLRRLRLDAK